ncbi:hypothetical protein SAMD00019534_104540 [Acytostelium subglobosum LB1]|uniref:hypothetical protein n=1 Tax=Acytostelium subglobosum LB1 TaxID=1410327 RepID=UPI000644E8F1|nr:hypothetical protein SAMD00019534_104540 [Acytostelium subglobosum LB1]GAM27279.1 hypothetical protein SAMD00019534_104540 [Acytostelium subglobosum LB1]|eukprot:XP_012749746.1 hypothetical protein SAMD00019534_104540 [Acytostelium subglobosum LB1]
MNEQTSDTHTTSVTSVADDINNNNNNNGTITTTTTPLKYDDRYRDLLYSKCYFKLFIKLIARLTVVESRVHSRNVLFKMYSKVLVSLVELSGDVVWLFYKITSTASGDASMYIQLVLDDGTGAVRCHIDTDTCHRSRFQSWMNSPRSSLLGKYVRVWGHLDIESPTNIIELHVSKLEIVDDLHQPTLLSLQCIDVHNNLYIPYSNYLKSLPPSSQ